MIVKLLTKHNLEFLSLKGGCTGSSKSTLVKVSNFWKSHAVAHLLSQVFLKANKILNGFSKRTAKLLIFQPVHILMCKAHIYFFMKVYISAPDEKVAASKERESPLVANVTGNNSL